MTGRSNDFFVDVFQVCYVQRRRNDMLQPCSRCMRREDVNGWCTGTTPSLIIKLFEMNVAGSQHPRYYIPYVVTFC